MFHTADAGYFWSETRVESSLNRFEATSLTEWEECVIVAANASPQLVRFTIFQLDYASSFPQGGHLRRVIKTTWMLQPATLGNQTVPFMRLVDLAVVADTVVFTQASEVTLKLFTSFLIGRILGFFFLSTNLQEQQKVRLIETQDADHVSAQQHKQKTSVTSAQ